MALVERHPGDLDIQRTQLWTPPQQDELLSFIVEGSENLPMGINIEPELEAAMEDHGGTLQYWKVGEEVGTAKGFDREYFQRKFDSTVNILKGKGVDVDPADVEKTQAFIDEIFGVYTGETQPYRQSNSFAFVAASRTKRDAGKGEFNALDYRRETVGCLPILKYVDTATAQRVLVGMPPFALDYYGEDSMGGGGIMIFAPLSLDMPDDLFAQHDPETALNIAENLAKETSWFARDRFGVKLMALAALLPKVTNWGKMFEYPGVQTTTGHGFTTYTIGTTIEAAANSGLVDPRFEGRQGVIGVGGIGEATADLILSNDPDVQVAINDHIPERLDQVTALLRDRYGEKRVVPMRNPADVMRFGGVTVSAITKPIDLRKTDLKPGELEGRVYGDDSQPAMVAAEQVIEYGGTHVGVIVEDGSDFGAVTGKRFNYGGMGPLGLNHAYGCCAEGAALYYGGGMEHRVSSQVDGDMTRAIGRYGVALGFKAAPLQTIINGKAQRV